MKTFGKYLEEKNKGLWDNIHAKRKRGEKMRKPGSKGAPTDADFKRSQEESLDISEISLDMLTKKISNTGMATTKKANKMDKTKNDLAAMRARLAGKPAMAKESVELDELSKKTLGSYIKKASGSAAGIAAVTSAQAAIKGKSNPDDKRQLRNRLTGISRATDKVTKEAVMSADKKPEKFVKPDGTVGIRMVRVDKQVIKKDA
jgi:hypothetical protein